MNPIQIGFPRSGNFWLYRILEGALERAGVARRRYIRRHPIHQEALTWDLGGTERAEMDMLDIEPEGVSFRIGRRFREPVNDLGAYARATTHACSHSPWCDRSAEVLGHFSHVVYVVRDPRDAIVSLAHYAFSPYMRDAQPPRESDPQRLLALRHRRLARAWTRHVGGYLDQAEAGRVHLVRFERLIDNFQAELGGLLAHLGLELDPAARDSLSRAARFETMRADAPDHLRRGRAGAWEETLTSDQSRRILRIAAATMARLDQT